MELSIADQANQQMVDRLISEGALWSIPIIAAFRATPRHRFLDRVFQQRREFRIGIRRLLKFRAGDEEVRRRAVGQSVSASFADVPRPKREVEKVH